MNSFAAVVAAAGEGLRMGVPTRKQYLFLEGIPVLARSLNLFLRHPQAGLTIAVIPPGEAEVVLELLDPYCPVKSLKLIEGGDTRQESVDKGLEAVPEDAGLVCIHDAARPLASTGLLEALLKAAAEHGAAVPVVALSDTVKEVDERGFVLSTPPRERMCLVQTPQVFRRGVITGAYQNAKRCGLEATDDAALVEFLGKPVAAIPGELSNLKITSPLDLMQASQLLKGAEMQ